MTFEEFELLPRKPGWKYEFLDGQPRITPAEIAVVVEMKVQPRTPHACLPLRPPVSADAPALIAAFLEAFCHTPDYYGWSEPSLIRSANEHIEGYFRGRRGAPMDASRVALADSASDGSDGIAAAALVVREEAGPLLSLLFVRPVWQRRGVGTDLVTAAMNALYAAGEETLASMHDLANEPSAAWHRHFGFVELPDLHLAERRARLARHELWRRERIGDLAAEERAQLARECARWQTEVERLREVEEREGYEAVTPILRRRRARR